MLQITAVRRLRFRGTPQFLNLISGGSAGVCKGKGTGGSCPYSPPFLFPLSPPMQTDTTNTLPLCFAGGIAYIWKMTQSTQMNSKVNMICGILLSMIANEVTWIIAWYRDIEVIVSKTKLFTAYSMSLHTCWLGKRLQQSISKTRYVLFPCMHWPRWRCSDDTNVSVASRQCVCLQNLQKIFSCSTLCYCY